jgi:hypothetical protein
MAGPNASARLLVDSSARYVEIESWRFRVEAITARDLMLHTSKFLVLLKPDAQTGKEVEAAANGDVAAAMSLASKVTANEVAETFDTLQAVVCAGVRDFRHETVPDFAHVEFVIDREKEVSAPEKTQKLRLWIGRLPKGVVQALAGEIFALSSNDGRAAERLASFRR